jgi:predicted PurR-regulated permease PerM
MSALEKNKYSIEGFYLALAMLTLTLFILSSEIFLIGLSSYIFYLFISGAALKIKGLSKISYLSSVGAVLSLLLLLTVVYWYFIAPIVAEQLAEFIAKVPTFKSKFVSYVQPYFQGVDLKEELSLEKLKTNSSLGGAVFSKINLAVSGMLSALTTAVVIFVVGIYISIEPQKYRSVFIYLLPKDHREAGDDLLDQLTNGARGWLLGRLLGMLVVGVFTTIGLYIIGVKLALSLGLIAAVASFIPNLGPILSLIPALGVALLDSPKTAVSVLILYGSIQLLESYLITPLINEETVSLPPAWLLLSQLLFGSLFGILGLALAAPITVMMTILVRRIFINKILGDDSIKPLVS